MHMQTCAHARHVHAHARTHACIHTQSIISHQTPTDISCVVWPLQASASSLNTKHPHNFSQLSVSQIRYTNWLQPLLLLSMSDILHYNHFTGEIIADFCWPASTPVEKWEDFTGAKFQRILLTATSTSGLGSRLESSSKQCTVTVSSP